MRRDFLIQYRWPRDTPPQPELPGDGYSTRWRGWLYAPAAGKYQFMTRNDDGVRLWIGEELVIDDWKSHAPEDRQGAKDLARGIFPIVLEHFDESGDAVLRVYWRRDSDPVRALDGRYLFHTWKDKQR